MKYVLIQAASPLKNIVVNNVINVPEFDKFLKEKILIHRNILKNKNTLVFLIILLKILKITF